MTSVDWNEPVVVYDDSGNDWPVAEGPLRLIARQVSLMPLSVRGRLRIRSRQLGWLESPEVGVLVSSPSYRDAIRTRAAA
jgi:hypothetical protein